MKPNLRRVAATLQQKRFLLQHAFQDLKQNLSGERVHVSAMSADSTIKELSKKEVRQMVTTHAKNKAARNSPAP